MALPSRIFAIVDAVLKPKGYFLINYPVIIKFDKFEWVKYQRVRLRGAVHGKGSITGRDHLNF